MSAERPFIYYVHKGATSFIRRDREYLALTYDIREFAYTPKGAWSALISLVWQVCHTVVQMRGAQAVVCQFAGHHSLIPLLVARLYGVPSLILSNGSDCVSFPSLKYGHHRKWLLSRTTCLSFRLCDRIVPLSAPLAFSRPTYHDIDGPEQGILHYCKGVQTPIVPLGYGYDTAFWKPVEITRKPRFLTVAADAHLPYIRVLKGLDMIMEVAPCFPDHEFHVIGARPGSLGPKPGNVIEVPFVPNEELPRYYSEATFYLQLSVSEGFGNALCEAMACGCIPIVSDVGVMPDIIGDAGVVVPRRELAVLEQKISEALKFDARHHAELARSRILQNYPAVLRQDGLIGMVDELIGLGES